MKTYQQPYVDVLYLKTEDVITTSPTDGDNDKSDFDDWGNPT